MDRRLWIFNIMIVLFLIVSVAVYNGVKADKPSTTEITSASMGQTVQAETEAPTAESLETNEAETPAVGAPLTDSANPVQPTQVASVPPATPANGNKNTGNTSSRGTQTITYNYLYPLLSKNNGSYGQFYYREAGGGRIEINPDWVAANITTITLPGVNQKVQVNKNAADNFIYAFTLIKNGHVTIKGRTVPLLSLVDTIDGTFVSRHVNWNPSRGLSNHSWGTAIDINAYNHFGYVNPSKSPTDANYLLWKNAFQPAGFSWGNSYYDAMHFELLD